MNDVLTFAFVPLSDEKPLSRGFYNIFNAYGCNGSPGAETKDGRSFCKAGVQWPTKVSGLGVYNYGTPSDWELVPVKGERWGYRIRTPECSYDPSTDKCWYWYVGIKDWVHVNTLAVSKRAEGDVFYIQPFARGWKISPRRDDCDMAAHLAEPCLKSLAWGKGSAGVRYVGMWAEDTMYHYTIKPIPSCRQAHWEIEKGETPEKKIEETLGSPC